MPLKCSYIREMHVKVQILAFVVEISCDFIDRHDLGRIGIGFFLHQWILNFLMLLFSPRRQSVYLAPPSSNPSWIKEALPPEHPSHIPPYGGCTREQAFEQCFITVKEIIFFTLATTRGMATAAMAARRRRRTADARASILVACY